MIEAAWRHRYNHGSHMASHPLQFAEDIESTEAGELEETVLETAQGGVRWGLVQAVRLKVCLLKIIKVAAHAAGLLREGL